MIHQTQPATIESPVISDTPKLPLDGYTRLMPLAEYLGVHHHTVRRWIKDKKMPQPKNINGVILFENSKIHEWLDKNVTA